MIKIVVFIAKANKRLFQVFILVYHSCAQASRQYSVYVTTIRKCNLDMYEFFCHTLQVHNINLVPLLFSFSITLSGCVRQLPAITNATTSTQNPAIPQIATPVTSNDIPIENITLWERSKVAKISLPSETSFPYTQIPGASDDVTISFTLQRGSTYNEITLTHWWQRGDFHLRDAEGRKIIDFTGRGWFFYSIYEISTKRFLLEKGFGIEWYDARPVRFTNASLHRGLQRINDYALTVPSSTESVPVSLALE